MDYSAPTRDMRSVLDHVCDIEGLADSGGFEELSGDLIDAILEEAGKFAAGVFAPLNRIGDEVGSKVENGVVRTPPGFPEAYRQFVEAGWNCLSGPTSHGGQGLPFVLQVAVQEMMTSANMSFSLCPMLTQGAVEALVAHGSEAQKATYLAKLISGEWTGTMNLTEPQAGSDVGALKTKAVPQDDGSYLIKGTKIYITWGEHDCADNIVHLVLARLPDAPPGTRGISLFIVPKFLVKEDGSLGDRNDLRCVSLEEKLGIHASPTAVMSYGDNDNCVGYLLGEENRGMAAMFTMMNNARINVGLQGTAIAERAYQAARAYAKERVQSSKFGADSRDAVPIIEHADVRRMLSHMAAQTAASRAIVYLTASAVDRAHHAGDSEARAAAQGLADLLTPIAKAHSTDIGVEVASIGIQVFGGMGYVEETGAAQHLRDARIAPIYEGTNGIQALDLVGRKLPAAGGMHWRALLGEMEGYAKGHGNGLDGAVSALKDTTEWLAARLGEAPDDAAAGATPYLRMFGTVLGGYLLAKQADADPDRAGDLAQFYLSSILPTGVAQGKAVTSGHARLAEIS